MVKSHTECSAELVWQMVKKQNSFIRASVNNTRFSCEPGNVTNEHGFSSSGIANIANTVDIRDLPNTKTPATSLNGKANKGIFRNQARAVANACQNRQDLKKKALARVANLNKLGRVCKATSSA